MRKKYGWNVKQLSVAATEAARHRCDTVAAAQGSHELGENPHLLLIFSLIAG